MQNLPIDPSKPVKGNAQGTFAGFVAGAAVSYLSGFGVFDAMTGFLGSHGFCVVKTVDNFLESKGMQDCADLKLQIIAMVTALIVSLVNYRITHSAQVKNLSELYDMIPSTFAEFPGDKDKPQSEGMDNGNFNKG